MKLDSERTHLDILRSTLELLVGYPPREAESFRGCNTGEYNCAVCGFPLTGKVKEGLDHETYLDMRYSIALFAPESDRLCKYRRTIAELEAWIRAEEELEQLREMVADAREAKEETDG